MIETSLVGCYVIFFALAVIGGVLWPIIKYGGFKAAQFGARIDHTVGEVQAYGAGPVRVRLKVHKLADGKGDRAVGVEIVAKSFAGYQMMGVPLTVESTRELIQQLEASIQDR